MPEVCVVSQRSAQEGADGEQGAGDQGRPLAPVCSLGCGPLRPGRTSVP